MMYLTLSYEQPKSVGIKRIYPSCEKSAMIAELMNKKVFSRKQVRILEALGYEVFIMHDDN